MIIDKYRERIREELGLVGVEHCRKQYRAEATFHRKRVFPLNFQILGL